MADLKLWGGRENVCVLYPAPLSFPPLVLHVVKSWVGPSLVPRLISSSKKEPGNEEPGYITVALFSGLVFDQLQHGGKAWERG